MSIPSEPVREGSRWRYHKPSGEQVAEWFKTVPLDADMAHDEFVSGVVIIPASEKVKMQTERNGRPTTEDAYEMTFTPYVRVDTRVSYFRKLAAQNEQIAVIEPVAVPTMTEPDAMRNDNMPPGFWWHVVKGDGSTHVRYLCCTMRVALYRPEDWFAPPAVTVEEEGRTEGGTKKITQVVRARSLREGTATKQVVAAAGDPNALAKAETGAVGRALGMAGILVVGTGLATAEDMAEVRDQPQAPSLPDTVQGQETPEQVNESLVRLSAELRTQASQQWAEFSAWWQERQNKEGWSKLDDAPIEVRRGMVRRMETMLAEATPALEPTAQDSSQG